MSLCIAGPPRRPGMIPLSLREIAAITAGTVVGDGAVTVTAPAVLGSRPTPLPTVVAGDARAALQALAANVVARLRDRLAVAGVTGSRGKTSNRPTADRQRSLAR